MRKEGGTVCKHRVDLPKFAVRCALHPELVLLGVTAGRTTLIDGGQASVGETSLFGIDAVGIGDFDSEVVNRSATARILYQDQLERWFGNGEVGIPLPSFGGPAARRYRMNR